MTCPLCNTPLPHRCSVDVGEFKRDPVTVARAAELGAVVDVVKRGRVVMTMSVPQEDLRCECGMPR